MTGSVASLVPFAAIVTFVYYILARAEITRPFWEGWVQGSNGEPMSDADIRAISNAVEELRERPLLANANIVVMQNGPVSPSLVFRFRWFLDRLLSCPMCSGWWIGLALGWTFDLPVSAWAVKAWGGLSVVQILAGGVYGLVLCPIVLGAMYRLRHQESMEHYAAENVRLREQDTGALMGRFDEILSAARPPEVVFPPRENS